MNSLSDLTHLHLNFLLFGIVGSAAREGLNKLTAHQGNLGGVLWANFGGSLIMGFLVRHPFLEPPGVGCVGGMSKSEVREVPQLIPATTTTMVGGGGGGGGAQDTNFEPNPNPNPNPSCSIATTNTNTNTPAITGIQEEGASKKDTSSPHKRSPNKHLYKNKAELPLYVGLSTGLCGSITSLSSFILTLFEVSANTGGGGSSSPPHLDFPNPAWGIPMWFAYCITMMCVSVGGFVVGKHCAEFVMDWARSTTATSISMSEFGTEGAESGSGPAFGLRSRLRPRKKRNRDYVGKATTSGLVSQNTAYWVQFSCSILGLLTWITVFILSFISSFEVSDSHTVFSAITQSGGSRYWCLSLTFAPFGVFLRYWCSRLLNPHYWPHRFLLGTFVANILATMVLAVLALVQNGVDTSSVTSGTTVVTAIVAHPGLTCDVVKALADGFCGCLSTVSTMVSELFAIKKLADKYIYGAISVLIPFASMVLIFGSYIWTNGIASTTC